MSTVVQTTLSAEAVQQLLIASMFQSLAAKGGNEHDMYAAIRDWALVHLDRMLVPKVPGKLDGRSLAADVLTQVTFDDPHLEHARLSAILWLRETTPVPPPAPVLTLQDDLLTGPPPWVASSLIRIDPAWASSLTAYCRTTPRLLLLANMAALPDAMRAAGFSGRDNALWYCVSRSYAEWPWSADPNDPDSHLSNQRAELRDFWANYLVEIDRTMIDVVATNALFLLNDGPDRCGDVLSEYSLRQLDRVGDRVGRGELYVGVLPQRLGAKYVLSPSGAVGFWDGDEALRVAQRLGHHAG